MLEVSRFKKLLYLAGNEFYVALLAYSAGFFHEEITPLHSCQFFFKKLQPKGAREKALIIALIKSIKQKTFFDEQVQTQAALKNGWVYRNRIQLAVRNGNQNSGRTEETLSSGEETFFSGEETLFSSEETLSSAEETFFRGEETLSRGEETFFSSEETFFRGEETLFSSEETLFSSEETLSSGEETFFSGEETLSSAEETFFRGEETLSCGVAILSSCKKTFESDENNVKRSNALCRIGNKGKNIKYIK